MTLCDRPSFAGDPTQHTKLSGVIRLMKRDHSQKRANGFVGIIAGRKRSFGVEVIFGQAREGDIKTVNRYVHLLQQVTEFNRFGGARQSRRSTSVTLQSLGTQNRLMLEHRKSL